LFVVASGERSRPHARLRPGFIRADAGSPGFAESTQIAESEAKSVAEEEEDDAEKNAHPVKEEEEESESVAWSIGKKEVESIADSVTKEIGITDAGSNVGGGRNAADNGQAARWPHRQDACATIADTAVCSDAHSNHSAGNFTWGNSAGRGREIWICRRSGLRTAAKPDAASWLVALVATGSCLPVPFAVGAK
jgi:hypothetical protein